MGVFTHERDVTSPIPPFNLFKAFVLDFDSLFPMVASHFVESVEIVEGNGGPGTIKMVTFAEDWGFSYLKHKVDELDRDNLSYTYTTFESDYFKDKVEKVSYESKFVAAPDGGTIVKVTTKIYTIGDIEIDEDVFKYAVEKRPHLFKAVEDYLLEYPDA